MKYKFSYEIYTVSYTFEGEEIRNSYNSMVYTSVKRAYNGLIAYLQKNWEYIKATTKGKPRYEICERDDNYGTKAIDGGFCKRFIEN